MEYVSLYSNWVLQNQWKIFWLFFTGKILKIFSQIVEKILEKNVEKRKNCEGNFTCSEEKCIRENGCIIRVVLADSAGKCKKK